MTRFTPRRHAWAEDLAIMSFSAGAGPALVLLHGYPETHLAWLAAAERLAAHFSVVMIDLRGYGDSIGPVPDAAHSRYSKRAMAGDVARVMAELGHERYAVAGHDRGGRVAHRLALDHPEAVRALVSLTVIPTAEMWRRMNLAAGLHAYHWYLLAQPAPLPETLLAADPDLFLDDALARMTHGKTFIDPAALAEYRRCFRQASVRLAMIEDYRAAAGFDLALDEADQAAGRRVACPLLVIWQTGRYAEGETPVQIWRRWADGPVAGATLATGHLMMEEQPAAVAEAITTFLQAPAGAIDDEGGTAHGG
jgi:haloacetate dehalogenase